MTDDVAMQAPFFTDGGRPVPDEPVRNIFVFCCLMAAYVAHKRGVGRPFDYIRECADFMGEVVGRRLSIADPLPPDFSWRPRDAIECGDGMLEYDS